MDINRKHLTNTIPKQVDSCKAKWDQQLQLIRFAYQSSVHESSRKGFSFFFYECHLRLLTGTELENVRTGHLVDYRTEFYRENVQSQQDCPGEHLPSLAYAEAIL